MLAYFVEQRDISEVDKIKEHINQQKEALRTREYENSYKNFHLAKDTFDKIAQIAVDRKNETLANANYIAKTYLHLLCSVARYFDLLTKGEYKESWLQLQDCLGEIIEIGRFTEVDNRYDVAQIDDLLHRYESLYPYHVFASSEMVIEESECSICGNSMLGFDCPHIKGQLYWGKVACEIIHKVKYQAVAMVSHPLDKRCVITLPNDELSQEEIFPKLDSLVKNNPNPYRLFEVQTIESWRRREDIPNQERNEKCNCGSGKKFGKCCSSNLYYKHVHWKFIMGDEIAYSIIH